MKQQGVVVLGATGSIGRSTLDVISRNPDRYRLIGVTAHRDLNGLAEICDKFRPDYAVMADPEVDLREVAHGSETLWDSGADAVCALAGSSEAAIVVAGIVGAAGLLPTLAAVRQGKRVLLANKEALVMSGRLFMDTARQSGARLLPIDSEHNAIFQCLPYSWQENGTRESLQGAKPCIRRVMLTASGGPFLEWPAARLEEVTVSEACRHPHWSMGQKISVDSATLMNKGLELIEACWLFDLPVDAVQVHVHPQAIIHSMVEYRDGSIIAQLGSPDMRTPIANALGWPDRIDSGVTSLDLFSLAGLHFEAPDLKRFPSLRLAAEAHRAGGTAPIVLNAANEVAVQAFLDERIRFTQIPQMVAAALEADPGGSCDSIEAVVEIDRRVRDWSLQSLLSMAQ